MSFNPERFAREMPLLHRLNGVFTGRYMHVDPNGALVDEHLSHMLTFVDPDGRHQINTYTWPDGRREVHAFHTVYTGGGVLRFDTERIDGVLREVDGRMLLLDWRRKDIAGERLTEAAWLSDDGAERTRVWHRFRDDRLIGRVLIREQRQPDGTPP